MLLEALAGSRVLALQVVQSILLELFASGAALPVPSHAQLIRSLDEVILRRSEQRLLASQNLLSCWLA